MSAPTLGAVVRLLRLPAVLTVPGDSLVGAAAAGSRRTPARALGLVGASCSLYLAGMALNDWADRHVDAVERPSRPVPAGEVTPSVALGIAAGLTAAGVGLAAAADGRRGLRVALPLAGTVWAYDLVLKDTALGPAAMATARGLDVLLGADPLRAALPAAGVVAAHTLKITSVSRHEVPGGAPEVARRAAAATTAVTAAAAALAGRALIARPDRWLRAVAAAGLLGAYASTSTRVERQAGRRPTPEAMQRAVGTGVLGFMPLDAGLHAAAGPLPVTAGIAALWPLARKLARRRAVT